MNKPTHFIYVLRNSINGKLYVGQTKNIKSRWSSYKSAIKSSKPYAFKHIIVLAMKKHGIENFTMTEIEQFDNKADCNEAEVFWIEYFESRRINIGYNVARGGNVMSPSAETRAKMSASSKRMWQNPEYRERMLPIIARTQFKPGHEVPETTKQALREALTDRPRIPGATSIKPRRKPNPSYKVGRGEQGPNSKLTWDIVNAIREDHKNGLTCKQISVKYNVPKGTLPEIVKFKTWKVS